MTHRQMKHCQLTTLTSFCLLFVSCSKEAPTPEPKSQRAPEPVSVPEPSSSTTQPAPPKSSVNLAKLNQDLLTALSFNQSEKAIEAIKAGASPKVKNRNGLPVIFIAAQAGAPSVVKALLAAGADPKAKIGTSFNNDGVGYSGTIDGTVLGYAAAKGNTQVMQYLVTAGADVDDSGPDGTTPLMQAAKAGKYEVVRWLIDAGANPNAKNKHGGTALGDVQMVVNPDADRKKIIDLLKSKSQ